jgi:hypothetical protein
MTQYCADASFLFYTDVKTGEAYGTQRGIHKLIGGKHNFWQLKSLKASVDSGTKMAEVPTAGGLQGAKLYSVDVIMEVLYYYAFKGNKSAQKSLKQVGKGGITAFIHARTGHQLAHSQVQRHFNWLDLREDAIQVNSTIMAQGRNSAFDALNIAYFGMRCRDHKEARFLQEAHRYENLPDYVDVQELEQLIYLRKKFTRICDSYPERINRAVSETREAFVH